MKIRTWFNPLPTKGQKFTKPSMTVPDQAMPISEILRRFAHGLPIGVNNNVPLFDGEDGTEQQFSRMDKQERLQFSMDAKAELDELKLRYSTAKSKYDENKKLKKLEEKIRKDVESQQSGAGGITAGPDADKNSTAAE